MFSPTPSPISRTVAYRKITKPLLERKRRARINRCLDELKDLMYSALEAEGENVEKLEKADILEFTVRHLQKITRRDPVEEAYKFQEGFSHCASEACSFLLSLPGLDSVVGRRLVEYLAKSVSRALESQVTASNKPPAATAQMATVSPAAVATASVDPCSNGGDNGDDSNGGEVAVRGHTPPSSNPSSTPPVVATTPSGRAQQATMVNSDLPPQKPVALTLSNRSPHTVVRPKPTRPAFGLSSSSSSSPHSHDVAAAAVAAAQRDPMWRPW